MGIIFSFLTKFIGEDLLVKGLKWIGIGVAVLAAGFAIKSSIERNATTKERYKVAQSQLKQVQRDLEKAKKIENEDRDIKKDQDAKEAAKKSIREKIDAAIDKKDPVLDRVCIPRDLARKLRDY